MATEVRVGERVGTRNNLRMLPLGVVIQDSEYRNRRLTKIADDRWNVSTGGVWTDWDLDPRYWNIVSFPDGKDVYVVPQPTLVQVKYDFRMGALTAAQNHGASIGAVEQTLTKMGCGAEFAKELDLGPGMVLSDPDVRRTMPDGTVIYSGAPQVPSTLAVWVKRNGQWAQVLGERNYMDNSHVIESINGTMERPTWTTEVGTEQDAEAIQEWKGLAWRVGYELKRSSGWCGTYEEIVHRLGIRREDMVRTTRVGDWQIGQRIEAVDAPALPGRSILWWYSQAHPERVSVFVRDNRVTNNQAQTRRVLATPEVIDGDQYKRRMMIGSVWVDDRNTYIGWLVPEDVLPRVWPVLPPGTRFRFSGGGAHDYVIAQDHNATDYYADQTIPETGRWNMNAFGSPENRGISIMEFPG